MLNQNKPKRFLMQREQLFNVWVDAIVNNDRDILKLSFGGILLIGSLMQFINFPVHSSIIYVMGIYVLSALAFLISLITSLYKLKINANYLLEFGTNGKSQEILKSRIQWSEQLIYWSFVLGMAFTCILIVLLLILKMSRRYI